MGHALTVTARARAALALVSGLLLAASFPKFGHSAVAWVALAPLLAAVVGQPAARGFRLGLLAGSVYFAGTLYWISGVMATFGAMPFVVAVLINGALVAYLALYPAIFGAVMARLSSRFGMRALAAAPCVWVATELARTLVMTGFPWVLLGYSQASVLPVAQVASVAGVYGVSWLVAAVSAALAYAVLQERGTRPVWSAAHWRPLYAVAVAVALCAVWGGWRVHHGALRSAGTPVRVGLVQGNVDQAEKWDVQRSGDIFGDYLRLTRDTIAAGARVVIWPESSTPFFLREDEAEAEQVRRIARDARVPIVVGSDDVQRSAERGGTRRYYNAAFLIGADGSDQGVYHKMHLVPFGEYVPLRGLLFFVDRLVQSVSDFSPGAEPVLLSVDGHPISTSICYEVVYPAATREFVRRGSELLATMTNDAWFGTTSAPYQHFAQASMRAIETGRYLVRAANTGITGMVDPYGQVLAQTRLNETTALVGDVRFLQGQTIYVRTGDAVAWASVALVALLLAASGRRVR